MAPAFALSAHKAGSGKTTTADDESFDADDHKPRVEVGTHSRVGESLVISNGDATR
jgi:hypothetical protein